MGTPAPAGTGAPGRCGGTAWPGGYAWPPPAAGGCWYGGPAIFSRRPARWKIKERKKNQLANLVATLYDDVTMMACSCQSCVRVRVVRIVADEYDNVSELFSFYNISETVC